VWLTMQAVLAEVLRRVAAYKSAGALGGMLGHSSVPGEAPAGSSRTNAPSAGRGAGSYQAAGRGAGSQVLQGLADLDL